MTIQAIPPDWKQVREIDLQKDPSARQHVSMLCFAIFAAMGMIGIGVFDMLPKQAAAPSGGWQLAAGALGVPLYVLALLGIRALLLRRMNGSWPTFGFRGGTPWTGFADKCLDRGGFTLVALAPVLGLAAVFAALALLLPGWFPALWFLLALDLGGAAADYLAVGILQGLPKDALCCDAGDALRFYVREEPDHAGEE